MLEVYKTFVEESMAIPVITGRKTEKEKFAGALHTYCIEAMMQDGKALQAGTSHNLAQNFAKAFDVRFLDEKGELEHVWATSWGVSTRLIGALIMTHSDDKGLVLPPKLAPTSVVLVPIWRKDDEKAKVLERADQLASEWKGKFSFKIDDRDNYRPGWKFNEWEKRGIPIRIELGPKDLEKESAVLVRRDSGEKQFVSQAELTAVITTTLDKIQKDLYQRAYDFREQSTKEIDDYEQFKKEIDGGGFFWAHWCGEQAAEEQLQNETKATIRCIPLSGKKESGKCLITGEAFNTRRVLIAKAY